MNKRFKNVAIFGRPQTAGVNRSLTEPLAHIAAIIEAADQVPWFHEPALRAAGIDGYAGYPLADLGRIADVAVVLGGDGTMLAVAREMALYNVPLIGINMGRLGFITDIGVAQLPGALAAMLRGEYEIDARSMLDAQIVRNGVEIHRTCAVNDVVIARGVAGGMVELTVRVDGETMYNQRADGLILATPTGSTAYALSANGPILHPSLAGFVLVPVAPQTLSNRPIALPDSVMVEIEIIDVRDASTHFDMQAFSTLAPGDIVRVRRAQAVATLLHPVGYNYFATLREKLHWNVMPSEPTARR